VLSIVEVRNDVKSMVEAAEASLSELLVAIFKLWPRLLPGLRDGVEPALLAELSILLGPDEMNMVKYLGRRHTDYTGSRKGRRQKKRER
jgi:hypothetical protein